MPVSPLPLRCGIFRNSSFDRFPNSAGMDPVMLLSPKSNTSSSARSPSSVGSVPAKLFPSKKPWLLSNSVSSITLPSLTFTPYQLEIGSGEPTPLINSQPN